MISVPIPELFTWSIRYENGEYFVDRHYQKSSFSLSREALANYPEQLKIIDRKRKLQKLLSE